MSRAPSIGVPELAGLGSYAEAARIGFSVDDTVASCSGISGWSGPSCGRWSPILPPRRNGK